MYKKQLGCLGCTLPCKYPLVPLFALLRTGLGDEGVLTFPGGSLRMGRDGRFGIEPRIGPDRGLRNPLERR